MSWLGDLTFLCVLILFLYAVGSFPTWARIFLVITLFLAFVASAFMVCTSLQPFPALQISISN